VSVCKTGKKRHSSERGALIVLAGIKFRRAMGRTHRREDRAYSCSLCGGWHLTSMPRGSQAIGEWVSKP